METTASHSATNRTASTPRRPSRRARVARRILRLRHDVRRYRRLTLGWAVLAACCLVVVAGLALGADDGSAPVDLGRGVAGVDTAARSAPAAGDSVDLPADLAPPPPPPPAPVVGEPLVRRVLGDGAASYYHDALEGRSTASGQPYRREALTAAHRSLPFGSLVRVTNLANSRSVVVRINDRGPFARQRVIDLSRAAARQIGLLARGHGRVRLELVE
jgi:rare lipoprotein A